MSVPNVPGNNSIARFAKNQGGVVQSWVKISKKRLLNKGIKKLGLNFNPWLVFICPQTTGPRSKYETQLTNLPSPATQCTAMHDPGFSLNFFLSNWSHPSTTSLGGAAPSSKAQSWKFTLKYSYDLTSSIKI